MSLKSGFEEGRGNGQGGKYGTIVEFITWTRHWLETNCASQGTKTKPTREKWMKMYFSCSMASEPRPSTSYASQLENSHVVQCQDKLAACGVSNFLEKNHSTLKMINILLCVCVSYLQDFPRENLTVFFYLNTRFMVVSRVHNKFDNS